MRWERGNGGSFVAGCSSLPVFKEWEDILSLGKHWPVHAEGTQVEDGDAHWGFLQERHQFTQTQAESGVVKRPALCQELAEEKHTTVSDGNAGTSFSVDF